MQNSFIYKEITQKFFQEEDEDVIDLGEKLLDFLFSNIAIRTKLKKKYSLIRPKFAKFIIDELKLYSTQEHVAMCMGTISKNREYPKIQKIQKQIEKLLLAKSEKSISKISKNTFVSNGRSNDTFFDDPFGDTFTNTTSISLNSLGLSLSKPTKVEESESRITDFNFSQIFNKLDLDQSAIQLKPQVNKTVRGYLQNSIKSYNAELNLVCQKMKFTLQDWKRIVRENTTYQSTTLIINNVYSGNVRRIFKATGQDKNSKNAKQRASLTILSQVYSKIPIVFAQIKKMKEKEGLVT